MAAIGVSPHRSFEQFRSDALSEQQEVPSALASKATSSSGRNSTASSASGMKGNESQLRQHAELANKQLEVQTTEKRFLNALSPYLSTIDSPSASAVDMEATLTSLVTEMRQHRDACDALRQADPASRLHEPASALPTRPETENKSIPDVGHDLYQEKNSRDELHRKLQRYACAPQDMRASLLMDALSAVEQLDELRKQVMPEPAVSPTPLPAGVAMTAAGELRKQAIPEPAVLPTPLPTGVTVAAAEPVGSLWLTHPRKEMLDLLEKITTPPSGARALFGRGKTKLIAKLGVELANSPQSFRVEIEDSLYKLASHLPQFNSKDRAAVLQLLRHYLAPGNDTGAPEKVRLAYNNLRAQNIVDTPMRTKIVMTLLQSDLKPQDMRSVMHIACSSTFTMHFCASVADNTNLMNAMLQAHPKCAFEANDPKALELFNYGNWYFAGPQPPSDQYLPWTSRLLDLLHDHTPAWQAKAYDLGVESFLRNAVGKYFDIMDTEWQPVNADEFLQPPQNFKQHIAPITGIVKQLDKQLSTLGNAAIWLAQASSETIFLRRAENLFEQNRDKGRMLLDKEERLQSQWQQMAHIAGKVPAVAGKDTPLPLTELPPLDAHLLVQRDTDISILQEAMRQDEPAYTVQFENILAFDRALEKVTHVFKIEGRTPEDITRLEKDRNDAIALLLSYPQIKEVMAEQRKRWPAYSDQDLLLTSLYAAPQLRDIERKKLEAMRDAALVSHGVEALPSYTPASRDMAGNPVSMRNS